MIPPQAEKTPRLRDNIMALGVVQLSNYAIPLITLPYLTRVLGPEAYGKVAFAQVLMAYFILLTDYGFSWSATRKISAHRAERAYISEVKGLDCRPCSKIGFDQCPRGHFRCMEKQDLDAIAARVNAK